MPHAVEAHHVVEALKTVSISGAESQCGAAALIQCGLPRAFRKGGLELIHVGPFALDTLYDYWEIERADDFERHLSVPSKDLPIGICVQDTRNSAIVVDLHTVRTDLVQAANKAANVLFPQLQPPLHNYEPGKLIYCPRGPDFERDRTVVEHHVTFTNRFGWSDPQRMRSVISVYPSDPNVSVDVRIPHPALFFTSLLHGIRTRSSAIVSSWDSFRNRHRGIRSGTVFLLRLFVELAERSGYSNPRRSDALTRHNIASALPRDYDSLETFASDRLDLYEKVVAKALDDPSSLTALYGLYGGESFPPSSTPTLEGEPEPVSVPSADLDIARIESITSINCFGGSGIPVEQEAKAGSTSLFVKASLFNHQCTSNASWLTHNNVMVVRARTAIVAGEEIFLTYRTVGFQAPIIEKHLGKDGCGCPLCTFDRLEGPVAVEKRKKLVRDQFPSIKSRLAETMMPSPAHTRLVRELERVIAGIEKTYSSSRPEQFRVELSEPLHVLADSQQFQLSGAARQRSVDLTVRSHVVRDGGISIKGGKVTVTRAPIDLGGNSVSTLLVCARRFAFRNDPDENVIALQWIQAAMDLEKMLSGGGYAVFRLRQDDAIRRLELDHLVDLLRL
ncbi:hypothetical protein JCM11491_003538 [Sporobolomyces phaffii]